MNRINRYIWFLIMIIIGGGAGLYYAWYVKPADFVDAALYNMRSDYKTDYVLMVAEIYDRDHDRLQAFIRLDNILAPSDPSRETVVDAAVEIAQHFDYNPVDLQKLYRLQEVVSGERSTPTGTPIPTSTYTEEQVLTGTVEPIVKSTEAYEPTSASVPVADSDPFNTGIRITTDPNAVPMLDLPPAPTITPNGEYQEDSSEIADNFDDDSFGFSGIPDDYFGGE